MVTGFIKQVGNRITELAKQLESGAARWGEAERCAELHDGKSTWKETESRVMDKN